LLVFGVLATFWSGNFECLVAAMCLCAGIESLVVLRDVCGLKAEDAEQVAR
jgi:hypothetical protein